MNPIGANLWIWDSPVTTDVIRFRAPRLRRMGFDLIEIPLENPGDWDPTLVGPTLDDLDLAASVCVAMGPGRDLTTGDRRIVTSTQDYLRRCIEAAAGVGASIVGGPMYAPTGVTGRRTGEERRAAVAAVAENLRPVLDDARESKVRLAIEPLNRFETSLFNTVEQAMGLVRIVDRPDLGLLLDTFHMNIEERSQSAAISAAGASLMHFHACGNDRGAPGRDAIDWPGIRSALEAVDYRGAVTIESFTAANRTIASAASIWRDLAPSQDELAATGLDFLIDTFHAGDSRKSADRTGSTPIQQQPRTGLPG